MTIFQLITILIVPAVLITMMYRPWLLYLTVGLILTIGLGRLDSRPDCIDVAGMAMAGACNDARYTRTPD